MVISFTDVLWSLPESPNLVMKAVASFHLLVKNAQVIKQGTCTCVCACSLSRVCVHARSLVCVCVLALSRTHTHTSPFILCSDTRPNLESLIRNSHHIRHNFTFVRCNYPPQLINLWINYTGKEQGLSC